MKLFVGYIFIFLISCNYDKSSSDSMSDSSSEINHEYSSYQQIDQNFIQCKTNQRILSQCEISKDSTIIAPLETLSLQYDIDYKSGCHVMTGKAPSYLYVKNDGSEKHISYDQTDWSYLGSFSGQEKILLIDKNPLRTRETDFHSSKPCFINFRYRVSLSSSAKARLGNLMINIREDTLTLDLVGEQRLLFSMLARDITALDLKGTKDLFANFKKYLQEYYKVFLAQEGKEIMISIDEIIALNSSVNPDSDLQEKISKVVIDINEITESLIVKISEEIARDITEVEKILAYSSNGQFIEYKNEIRLIKSDLSR